MEYYNLGIIGTMMENVVVEKGDHKFISCKWSTLTSSCNNYIIITVAFFCKGRKDESNLLFTYFILYNNNQQVEQQYKQTLFSNC